MKLFCSQKNLVEAINTVVKVSSKNSSELQYIYIEAGERLKIVSSSSNQTAIVELDAKIEEKGKLLVHSLLFKEIINKMPPEELQIEVNESYIMQVRCFAAKLSLQCVQAAAYTFLDDILENQSFSINTSLLKKCIAHTYFTSDLMEVNPVFSGISLKCVDGVLEFASTDGTRISLEKVNISSDNQFEMVIPAKLMYDVLHSSNKYDDEESVVTYNKKFVKIKTGNVTVVSGLIEKNFINVKSVIPSEYNSLMICDKDMLLSILERASLLSEESLYTVHFNIKYSKLYISSNSTAGEGYEEVCIQTDGEPISIAFNSRNFIEILRNIEYDILQFEFTTKTRACKIRPLETEDLMYLIFPIRT